MKPKVLIRILEKMEMQQGLWQLNRIREMTKAQIHCSAVPHLHRHQH